MTKNERIAVLEQQVADLKTQVSLLQTLLSMKQSGPRVFHPKSPSDDLVLPFVPFGKGMAQ